MSATPPEHPIEPEDIFSDSLQSLYDYAPITIASEGTLFHYNLTEKHLAMYKGMPSATLKETPALATVITLVTPSTEASNWSLHASSIWMSSQFLAEHIDDLHLDQHVRTVQRRGQSCLRVLELGAGAGLPSILVAKCFDGVHVTASDYPDPALIRTLQSNVERNDVRRCCRVVPYAWGSDPSVFRQSAAADDATQEDCRMDVIIAADTLWNSEQHALFLQTLQMLLRKTGDARVYLVACLHTGRYTLQVFIEAIERYGLVLEDIVEREVSGCCQRAWDLDRAEAEENKERRRWLVWMKLKWK